MTMISYDIRNEGNRFTGVSVSARVHLYKCYDWALHITIIHTHTHNTRCVRWWRDNQTGAGLVPDDDAHIRTSTTRAATYNRSSIQWQVTCTPSRVYSEAAVDRLFSYRARTQQREVWMNDLALDLHFREVSIPRT